MKSASTKFQHCLTLLGPYFHKFNTQEHFMYRQPTNRHDETQNIWTNLLGHGNTLFKFSISQELAPEKLYFNLQQAHFFIFLSWFCIYLKWKKNHNSWHVFRWNVPDIRLKGMYHLLYFSPFIQILIYACAHCLLLFCESVRIEELSPFYEHLMLLQAKYWIFKIQLNEYAKQQQEGEHDWSLNFQWPRVSSQLVER